jgi:hypothetical protein
MEIMAADPAGSITAWAVFSAIGGSIIGSVTGGLITFAFHKKQLRDQRRALAFSLLVKLMKVASGIKNLGDSIPPPVKDDNGNNLHYWQYVIPIVNLPDPIYFSADELSVALFLDDELFNTISNLDEIHKSMIQLFSNYARMRADVMSKLSHEIDGKVGTAIMLPDVYAKLAPKFVEMNDTIEGIKEFRKKDGPVALDAIFKLQSLMSKKLRVKTSVELKKTKKVGSTPAGVS